MANLVLQYEGKIIKELPVQKASIGLGRAPRNEIVIDNLAVSSHHAKVIVEEGRFFIEDLNSLNGTFLNNQLIRKSALKEGDEIVIGKHTVVFHEDGGMPASMLMAGGSGASEGVAAADQTVVLDTKKRREFLAKATAIAEEGSSESSAGNVACLVRLAGKTNQEEYILTSKICIIGKDQGASVQLKGWFLPRVAALITRRGRHFEIAPSDQGGRGGRGGKIRVNSEVLTAPLRLSEGDVIQIRKTRLRFSFRE